MLSQSQASEGAKRPLIDPNQRLKRMSISGQVTLQRKSYWVTRYAEIKDSLFSYKKDSSKWLASEIKISMHCS